MLLIDFSQIAISGSIDFHKKSHEQPDKTTIRSIIIKTLIEIKHRLLKYSDNIVICMDNRDYWRKDIFPNYKGNRKLSRDKSNFDWEAFYKILNELKVEFRNELPFRFVEVDRCEADDIIAVIATMYGPTGDVVIVSSDKDLIQIHARICDKVKQYSPYHEKFIHENGEYDFFTHIIKGDSSDGIPNIFSDDDTFLVESKRQVPVRTDKLNEWKKTGLKKPEVFCTSAEITDKFNRNLKLIDMTLIPQNIQQQIVSAYNASECKNRLSLFDYAAKHKLKQIIENGKF